ncbi:hypothetical protein DFJ74DRAFT_665372 [Hyaloraphidium curvatum]|nr:hypothetical protein DFJ74DRAFT_665372 [Hyaloraphidium curvatum]
MMLAKAAANHWLNGGTAGVFIANSSLAGMHGIYNKWSQQGYSYHVAKAGIISFCAALQGDLETRAWQAGLERSPIRTGAICPGAVFTPIMTKIGAGTTPEEVAKHPLWRHALPMGGWWTPMEAVVAAVMRLIEDEECRGTALVICGEGGEAKEYPKIDLEDFISRGSRGGSFLGVLEIVKEELLAAAKAAKADVNGGKARSGCRSNDAILEPRTRGRSDSMDH